MSLDLIKTQAAQLQKNGPLPLYYQIKQQLKSAIETFRLLPGQALPSERVLVE